MAGAAIVNELALRDQPAAGSRYGPTDPALVPPALERRLEPSFDDGHGLFGRQHPPAQGQAVGVVVPAAHLSRAGIVAQRGPDTPELIGGNRHQFTLEAVAGR